MKIELDGFQLRDFCSDDAESLAKSANDPRVAVQLRDLFPSPYTLADAEEWLAIAEAQDPVTNVAIADGPTVMGGIGLVLQDDIASKSAELGYWLAVDYWGRGIATQAVQRFVRFGFESFDLVRIFACVKADNTGSVRVLEKSGFTFEGRLRQAIFKNGKLMDSLMYSILRDEWSASIDPGAT